jgi:hypothetical protein
MTDQTDELLPGVPNSPTTSARSAPKSRLGQLMLLIAAVAIGIVGMRNCDTEMRVMQIDRRHIVNWIVLPSPLLMSLATTLMLAGLLPPRSPLHDLCRRPGFTACWVTTLVMTIGAVVMLVTNPVKITSFDGLIRCFSFGYFWPTTGRIGIGVLIAWTTLALTGCWRPEPSWIDRAGRVLGVAWIIAFVAGEFAWRIWL